MNANQFSANFYQCSCDINIQWTVVQKTAHIKFPLEGSKYFLVNSRGKINGRRFFQLQTDIYRIKCIFRSSVLQIVFLKFKNTYGRTLNLIKIPEKHLQKRFTFKWHSFTPSSTLSTCEKHLF